MTKRTWRWMAGLSGLVFSLVTTVFARSKNDDQDFPDYNHLEYAKPMPAPDEQVPQPPPGSIHMEVGGNTSPDQTTPLDELPVAIHPAQQPDTSEPSMDFFDNGAPPPPTIAASTGAPVVSSATVPVAPTPPATSKP